MASRECQVPHLSEISKAALAVAADAPVRCIMERFQENRSLLAVPVEQNGSFLGMVTRKPFYSLMSRPFATELYGKKPVSVLLADLNCERIVMSPDQDINTALARLVTVDPSLETDAFPLVQDEQCTGVVAVSDLMMAVSENQKQLVDTLDRLGARIREEVSKASRIQQDLLPSPEWSFNGVEIGAGLITSSEIGGDFYDYFAIGEHKIGLVIGDVSGHGVQSGMVTTAAKASLHTLIARGTATPAELLHGMNDAILATARQTLLMTCFIAMVDLKKGKLSYANAGHNFPYLYRGSSHSLEPLHDSINFPLGFEKETEFRECSTPFREGDTLFLYTDGIVECVGRDGTEFGYERLEKVLLESARLTPHLLREALLDAATCFTGTKSFEDDVTLLIASFQSDNSIHTGDN
ncbi:MAG: PP2C family protein-serine/threonine phosphatase [Geobacter sp.]|nr:PP2C family protein-serine/threonine phosphatase [Geobacter sp.]